MALDVQGIVDAVASHVLASGLFEQVNGHEPKAAPGSGLTAAVWVQRLGSVPSSGLASSSARLVLNVRAYSPLTQQPEDAIDPALTSAIDTLMAAYNGDFTLGGLARQVDVFGIHGIGLDAQAGYLEQDGAVFRVFTIVLPLIVNDLWEQVA
ncbi:hypothetical protein [Peterkaempfera sp. SMS 1(5)a]|uniref:hypothetical protein n=1 Tax=Peterkaempfera podocarpi TaxID=3232308 RepID=UPI00366AAC10